MAEGEAVIKGFAEASLIAGESAELLATFTKTMEGLTEGLTKFAGEQLRLESALALGAETVATAAKEMGATIFAEFGFEGGMAIIREGAVSMEGAVAAGEDGIRGLSRVETELDATVKAAKVGATGTKLTLLEDLGNFAKKFGTSVRNAFSGDAETLGKLEKGATDAKTGEKAVKEAETVMGKVKRWGKILAIGVGGIGLLWVIGGSDIFKKIGDAIANGAKAVVKALGKLIMAAVEMMAHLASELFKKLAMWGGIALGGLAVLVIIAYFVKRKIDQHTSAVLG